MSIEPSESDVTITLSVKDLSTLHRGERIIGSVESKLSHPDSLGALSYAVQAEPHLLTQALVELIDAGLEFRQCLELFAYRQSDEDRVLIELARERHHVDGEIEIDEENALVSGSEDGGDYVLAWVWVNDPEPVPDEEENEEDEEDEEDEDEDEEEDEEIEEVTVS